MGCELRSWKAVCSTSVSMVVDRLVSHVQQTAKSEGRFVESKAEATVVAVGTRK